MIFVFALRISFAPCFGSTFSLVVLICIFLPFQYFLSGDGAAAVARMNANVELNWSPLANTAATYERDQDVQRASLEI